jgi:hypothetical protein
LNELQKKLVHNTYYEKYNQFVDVVEKYFENISEYKKIKNFV